MKVNDEDVVGTLTSQGVPLDRWLALGSHLVGHFDETGRLMTTIIEDDTLAAAAVKFLRKRGQIHEPGSDDGNT